MASGAHIINLLVKALFFLLRTSPAINVPMLIVIPCVGFLLHWWVARRSIKGRLMETFLFAFGSFLITSVAIALAGNYLYGAFSLPLVVLIGPYSVPNCGPLVVLGAIFAWGELGMLRRVTSSLKRPAAKYAVLVLANALVCFSINYFFIAASFAVMCLTMGG